MSLDRYDGHASWVNSAALRASPAIPDTDPEGGVVVRDPSTGEPTGVFVDNARSLVQAPAASLPTLSTYLQAALGELASVGITTVSDMGTSREAIEDLFTPWAEAGNLKAGAPV